MTFYFKAFVKELYCGKKSKWATFSYCEKFSVEGNEYGIGYSLTSENDCNKTEKLEKDKKFIIEQEMIFQFISQHRTEQLCIEYENSENEVVGGKAAKEVDKYEVVGVKL